MKVPPFGKVITLADAPFEDNDCIAIRVTGVTNTKYYQTMAYLAWRATQLPEKMFSNWLERAGRPRKRHML